MKVTACSLFYRFYGLTFNKLVRQLNLLVGLLFILNIFDKKDDANIHKYDIGYGRKEAKGLNIIQLRDAINSIVDDIKLVRFEIVEKIIDIDSKKLSYILNEMIRLHHR